MPRLLMKNKAPSTRVSKKTEGIGSPASKSKPTCMRSLMRSRGAVMVLAAAPAAAAAMKRVASLGASAKSASGCLMNCAAEGHTLTSSSSSSLQGLATFPLPPTTREANFSLPGANEALSVLLPGRTAVSFNSPLSFSSPRPGMRRHTSTPSFMAGECGCS